MEDLNFKFFMAQTNKIPFHAAMHNHTCYELVYYLTGKGTLTINSIEYIYEPNTFALIEPRHNHSEIASEDTEIMYIGFANVTNEACFKSGLYRDFESEDILKILYTMNDEIRSKKVHYLRRIEVLTQDILILFERLCQFYENQTDTDTSSLENILKYIDLNFNTSIDIQALASLTGYSYHRFRHIFKEQYSLSPKQYILNRQLTESLKLLKHTDKSIGEISEECGFSSTTFFIQCFRKNIGTTPRQYRVSAQNNEMNIKYIEE